jgi:Hint module
MFDHYTTMRGIMFDDIGISKIDFCRADKVNVDDIYLTDLDGSLKPSTVATVTSPSSLISLRPNMLQFVDRTKCMNVTDKCYSYCQDTCFRGILYEVDPSFTMNFTMKLCQISNPMVCITVPGHRNTPDPFSALRLRYFAANVPMGQYEAIFLDSTGQVSWPSFVRQLVTDVTCPKLGTHTITMFEPLVTSSQCQELIRNGNFEVSNSHPMHWLLVDGKFQLVPGAGVDGSNALVSVYSGRNTFVQFLDTRCLKFMRNAVYSVSADIKLLRSNGTTYVCDPIRERCPMIGVLGRKKFFNASNVDDSLTMGDDISDKVVTVRSTAVVNSNGFQRIQATIRITDELLQLHDIRLSITSSLSYRLVVDNVAMRLANTTISMKSMTTEAVYTSANEVAYAPTNEADNVPSPSPVNCFSSSNLVEVKDVGYVPINQVQIGDYIRAGNGKDYTQVYGYGHFDNNLESEFVQVTFTGTNDSILEISSSHILFVQKMTARSSTMIVASDIGMDDILNNQTIRSIQRVIRRGVYAPLTYSGDFMINGIRVSNYVNLFDNKFNKKWDHHGLGHVCFLPQRLFCHYFMHVCQTETYINGYGIFTWIIVHVGRTMNHYGGWFENIFVSCWSTLCIILVAMVTKYLTFIIIGVLTGMVIVFATTSCSSRGTK